MRHVKFDLAVITVFLTASWTLLSHASIFEKPEIKSILISNCFPNLVFTTPSSCTQQALDMNVTTCSFAQNGLNNAAFSNAALMDPQLCVGSTVFCCAQLKISSQQCGLLEVQFPDGTFDYAAIDRIFCKSHSAPQ